MRINSNIALLETKKYFKFKEKQEFQKQLMQLQPDFLKRLSELREKALIAPEIINNIIFQPLKGEIPPQLAIDPLLLNYIEIKEKLYANEVVLEQIDEEKKEEERKVEKKQRLEDLVVVKLDKIENTLDVILKTLFTVANEFKLQTLPFSFIFRWIRPKMGKKIKN